MGRLKSKEKRKAPLSTIGFFKTQIKNRQKKTVHVQHFHKRICNKLQIKIIAAYRQASPVVLPPHRQTKQTRLPAGKQSPSGGRTSPGRNPAPEPGRNGGENCLSVVCWSNSVLSNRHGCNLSRRVDGTGSSKNGEKLESFC